ncbi:hypothetical protein ACFQYP_26470 [Nonomuraea antimicrobica]
MLIEQARRVARQWVLEEGAALPGFVGAFLTGSALWAGAGDELAPTSDVDVMLVTDPAARIGHIGKFRYKGVLLEVSSMAEPGSTHDVLSDYHLAGSFHLPCVLADPSGRLTELQRVVARDFAERPWILARCTDAMDRVRGGSTAWTSPRRCPTRSPRGCSARGSPPTCCWWPGCATPPSAAGTRPCASCSPSTGGWSSTRACSTCSAAPS